MPRQNRPLAPSPQQEVQTILAHAVRLHQGGRPAEAEQAYRAVLARMPNHGPSLKNLGLLLLQRNAPAEAEKSLAKAIKSLAGDPETWMLLGMAQAASQSQTRAEKSYRRSLALADSPVTRVNLGNCLATSRRTAEAEEHYRHALALAPDFVDAHTNLGVLLNETHRPHEAHQHFHLVVERHPGHVLGRAGLCLSLLAQGKADAVPDLAEEGLRQAPGHPVLLNVLGVALTKLGKPQKALPLFEQALAAAPHFAEAMSNAGNALRELGRSEEACRRHLAALALNPGYAEAQYNLGVALTDLGQEDQAMAAYRAAIGLSPNHALAHWNLSHLLLAHGQFGSGWAEYEWRLVLPEKPASPALPPWNGAAIPEDALLVWSEQGLGDTIQFCRLLHHVAPRCGRVVLEVQPCLARLLSGLAGNKVRVVPRDHTSDHGCGFQLPLLSLPRILDIGVTASPPSAPYLMAEPEAVERWRHALPGHGLRVGICWQGNAKASIDIGRSIPLHYFAPLARIPGVTLVSLQKNDGHEQINQRPDAFPLFDPGPDFDLGPDAFIDTAAIMANLDLVITSDTAVAHLAGALGRPVWVALKHQPEWRWMRGRQDSPWYPSARLFRQHHPGDWAQVFRDMETHLADLATQSDRERL